MHERMSNFQWLQEQLVKLCIGLNQLKNKPKQKDQEKKLKAQVKYQRMCQLRL